jgi:prophage maintenance system killer protein
MVEFNNEIIIYQTEDGQTSVDVKINNETVWLNRKQLSILFDRDVKTIGKHINNALKEELEGDPSVVAKFATTASDGKTYNVEYYSLDMISSIGFRVKSKRGVQFRKWANKVLKDYLMNGFVVKENIKLENYENLKQLINVLGRTLLNKENLTFTESKQLTNVVVDYNTALDRLDDYDFQRLSIHNTTNEEHFHASYENAIEAIQTLREKFGGSSLFGNEKDDSFKSSIRQIYQTFDGKDLYPSVEEKAAMLLYLVTKNHSFSDGNKRIAATLFLWFMNANGILYNTNGTKRIPDSTLVAITLMIAESRPEEKDTMIKVVVNLINNKRT